MAFYFFQRKNQIFPNAYKTQQLATQLLFVPFFTILPFLSPFLPVFIFPSSLYTVFPQSLCNDYSLYLGYSSSLISMWLAFLYLLSLCSKITSSVKSTVTDLCEWQILPLHGSSPLSFFCCTDFL